MADTTQQTAPAAAPATGFEKVLGTINGLNQVASGIGGIVDTTANAAEDIARGKAAMSNQRLDKEDRELSIALRAQAFERGDNKLIIMAVAASAVALILLTR